MHPSEEHFWSLVSLQLAGEATPEQQAEITQLLREHPEWSLRMELYTNLYKGRANQAAQQENNFSRHLQRLSNHLDTPVLQYDTPADTTQPPTPQKHKALRPLLAAAAAILAIAAGLYLLKPATKTDGFNTVTTRPGSRSRIQLPDGTTVWLNADSRLTYKVNTTEREVQLTGEAYFDVARDKSHPFHVRTNTLDIKVLGTSFDVRSYTNEHNTEASLFQGSVEVTLRNSPDKKIILHPEEKIIVNNNEAAVTKIKTKKAAEPDFDQPLLTLGKIHRQEKDSTITETLWTKNKLYFDNRSLEEVGYQLERWFGVRVTISDDNVKQRHISGDFQELNLAEVMEALQYTGVLHYTIKNKEVIITP